MKQSTDLIQIETDFAYLTSSFADLYPLERQILDYNAFFESMAWTKEELENISQQLVQTGRVFAEQQGFGPQGGSSLLIMSPKKNKFGTTVGHDIDIVPSSGPTGNLYISIKSEVEGNKVHFYNDAKNSRGQPYAGHMEYGFHDRGGNFIPARPFMRPAFYAVSEGSKGNFRGIMKGLLDNMWTSQGFNGISSLTFGHSRGSQSMFWRNPAVFSSKVKGMSRISQLRSDDFRKSMTASRIRGERKVGFSLAKNNRDYRRSRIPVYDKRGNKIRENKNWGRSSGRTSEQERARGIRYQEFKDNAAHKNSISQKIGRANSATDHSYRGGVKSSSRYGRDSVQARKDSISISSNKKSKKNSSKSSKYLTNAYVLKGRDSYTAQKISFLPIKDYLTKYELTTPSRAVARKYGKNKVYLREKEQ